MNYYNRINSLTLVATCVGITQREWDEYMNKVVRADKRKVDRLVKRLLPDLYESLCLQFYNPYNYFKKDGLIVLVHSGIEHFLEVN